MKKYYAIEIAEKTADIYIFGDIVSWEWLESDKASYTLTKEIEGLDVDTINVHINSYGGEVKEGLGIYNMLKNHKAKIRTINEGFACSAAAVIFAAGDERIMRPASLLMIHNAWTRASGNAEQLRKEADDLETISKASANVFRGIVNISDAELEGLLAAETWLSPESAVEKGFATAISEEQTETGKASQSARAFFMSKIMGDQSAVMSGFERLERKIAQMQETFAAGLPPEQEPRVLSPGSPAEPQNKVSKFLQGLAARKEIE